MNVLLFILAFVVIYKYIFPRLEGFDGNCFKRKILFTDSSLNMDNLVQWYNEKKTLHIALNGRSHYYVRDEKDGNYLDIQVQNAKESDFSGLYQEDIADYFKPITEISNNKVIESDYYDKYSCTLDYIY